MSRLQVILDSCPTANMIREERWYERYYKDAKSFLQADDTVIYQSFGRSGPYPFLSFTNPTVSLIDNFLLGSPRPDIWLRFKPPEGPTRGSA